MTYRGRMLDRYSASVPGKWVDGTQIARLGVHLSRCARRLQRPLAFEAGQLLSPATVAFSPATVAAAQPQENVRVLLDPAGPATCAER